MRQAGQGDTSRYGIFQPAVFLTVVKSFITDVCCNLGSGTRGRHGSIWMEAFTLLPAEFVKSQLSLKTNFQGFYRNQF